tara:strand:- start:673 stop:1428 length:756 start_codon:yes stop_codon:yes gene_type:complete
MAKNWNEAQQNEKKFWTNIYLENSNKMYEKVSDENLVSFTKEVLKRHNLSIFNFKEKIIADVGCGPFGVIKGLMLMDEKFEIKIKKIFGIDPLMEFYKEKIQILKENSCLKLIDSSGEDIPIEDQNIDYIFSTNVLDHCESPLKVISEAERILKKEGEFYCSVHVVFSHLSFIAPILKYFDTNHPKHFSESYFLKLLKNKFKKVEVTYRAKIYEDHPKFKFKNIFKNNFYDGLKRFLSHYILYTAYFSCKK